MRLFLRRVRSVAAKEYKHILRDPFTLVVALVLPLIFVGMFGFVIDLDYKHMRLYVRDNDQTSVSRRFLQEVSSSGYFDQTPLHGPAQADEALQKNNTPAVLIIKPGFGRHVKAGDISEPGQAQLLTDGTDNVQASIIQIYMRGIIEATNALFLPEGGEGASARIRTRFLFNPELSSRWFIVPALSTVIIGLLAIMLTALTVAKEWENGSMELLLSTPVRPAEIVLGKLIPYFLLALFDVLVVFVLALTVFRIPFEGSFLLYMLACAIYVTGALALGLVISVVTRQQQAAIQFAFAVGLLPSFIFSGFIFPIENMPLFFRWFTALFPQRWFLLISRTLFLSEAGFSPLAPAFWGIGLFAVFMIILAVFKFKTDVEP